MATGTFEARQILAVTFTEKAARELKERLGRLGVEGVEARTFHAAALSQLSRLWERAHRRAAPGDPRFEGAPDRLAGGRALPPPYKFLPRSELAGEIEWAKNRMIAPSRYLGSLGAAPAADAGRADARGLRRLRAAEAAHRPAGLRGHAGASPSGCSTSIRRRRTTCARGSPAFTVDEYQDVNPLQQALLERWLGGRDELCVVGDDYQTIYSFTGASPEHLLGFPRPLPERHRRAARGEPSLLAPGPDGGERAGPAPGWVREGTAGHEAGRAEPHRPRAAGRGRRGRVRRGRVPETAARRASPWDRMAVLSRINARSEPYEEAFAAAAIPYQVRDGAFLRRPGPRSVLARLRRVDATARAGRCRAVRHGRARLRCGGLARQRRGGDAPGGPRAPPRARRRTRGIRGRGSDRGGVPRGARAAVRT